MLAAARPPSQSTPLSHLTNLLDLENILSQIAPYLELEILLHTEIDNPVIRARIFPIS